MTTYLMKAGANATGHSISKFMIDGVITIGWPETDFSCQGLTTEQIEKRRMESPEYDGGYPHPRRKGYLETFANQMQKGDTVYLLYGRDIVLARGTITGDYEYRPKESKDFHHHHVRKVDFEWLPHPMNTDNFGRFTLRKAGEWEEKLEKFFEK